MYGLEMHLKGGILCVPSAFKVKPGLYMYNFINCLVILDLFSPYDIIRYHTSNPFLIQFKHLLKISWKSFGHWIFFIWITQYARFLLQKKYISFISISSSHHSPITLKFHSSPYIILCPLRINKF